MCLCVDLCLRATSLDKYLYLRNLLLAKASTNPQNYSIPRNTPTEYIRSPTFHPRSWLQAIIAGIPKAVTFPRFLRAADLDQGSAEPPVIVSNSQSRLKPPANLLSGCGMVELFRAPAPRILPRGWRLDAVFRYRGHFTWLLTFSYLALDLRVPRGDKQRELNGDSMIQSWCNHIMGWDW